MYPGANVVLALRERVRRLEAIIEERDAAIDLLTRRLREQTDLAQLLRQAYEQNRELLDIAQRDFERLQPMLVVARTAHDRLDDMFEVWDRLEAILTHNPAKQVEGDVLEADLPR